MTDSRQLFDWPPENPFLPNSYGFEQTVPGGRVIVAIQLAEPIPIGLQEHCKRLSDQLRVAITTRRDWRGHVYDQEAPRDDA